jgi:hypothetical protein
MLVSIDAPIPERISSQIGQLVCRWGQLEHVLALTIKRTVKVSIEEALVRARELNSIPRLTNEVRARFAVHAQNQGREGELTSLLQDVICLSKVRNDVVHGLWCFGERGEPLWLRAPARSEYEETSLDWLCNKIRDVTAAINALTRPDLVSWEGDQVNSSVSPIEVRPVVCQVSAA